LQRSYLTGTLWHPSRAQGFTETGIRNNRCWKKIYPVLLQGREPQVLRNIQINMSLISVSLCV